MNACVEMSSDRISYSLDYGQSGVIPVELTVPSSPPSSNPGFEFRTLGVFECERSSADELFEDGMTLPSPGQMGRASQHEEAQDQDARPQPLPFLSPLHLCPSNHAEAMEQTAEENETTETNLKPDQKIRPKSLLGFRSSSSLDYKNGKIMNFLLPLPALPRGNLVTSAAAPQNLKRRPLHKQQPSSPRMVKASSLPGYACSLPWRSYSPPLRTTSSGGTYCGSSMRVAPVLNIPNCCTPSDTAFLFGLGCLSLWGKEKKCKVDS